MEGSTRLPDIPESSTDPLENPPAGQDTGQSTPEVDTVEPAAAGPTLEVTAQAPAADVPPEAAESGLASLRRFLIELVQTAVLALLLFLAIDTATARIRVQSISMQPTLYEQDFVLVNRLAYRLGELHRKDVIVFNPPIDAAEEPYIKRVIGLPGDTIRIAGGQVFVNDQLLQETYLKAPPDTTAYGLFRKIRSLAWVITAIILLIRASGAWCRSAISSEKRWSSIGRSITGSCLTRPRLLPQRHDRSGPRTGPASGPDVRNVQPGIGP